MDEYLQHMKTLRSQMNDVEDQAAKTTVEEQMQLTAIQTVEDDISSAKSEARGLKEEAEQMVKATGQICLLILEKQKKIASLESDSSTLSQTLELVRQESISFSAKITEKNTYYTKVAEDINAKLRDQQDWIKSRNLTSEVDDHRMVMDKEDERANETSGNSIIGERITLDNMGDKSMKNLMSKLVNAEAKLNEAAQLKSKLLMVNNKMKHSMEQVKCRMNADFRPELREMHIKSLEEEHNALLADKSGENDYLKSLQLQIDKLKGISHLISCNCGEEYKVEMNLCI